MVRFASGKSLTIGRERWSISLGQSFAGPESIQGPGFQEDGNQGASPPLQPLPLHYPIPPALTAGGRPAAHRIQLPLELAWAMSVHKSQGMTLDRCELQPSSVHSWWPRAVLTLCYVPACLVACRVEVCLERAFEPGMAYVALRCAAAVGQVVAPLLLSVAVGPQNTPGTPC